MWFKPEWSRRAAIAVNNIGGNTGTVDATVPIPVEYEDFWTRVLATGADIRVTQADGITPVAYKRATWTHASRQGSLELAAVQAKNGTLGAWLYWGNAAASDGATTPTITTPKAGSIYLGSVVPPYVVAAPERAGATVARARFVKASAEEVRVFWDFRSRLAQTRTPISGSRLYEELRYVTLVDVLDSSEVSQAGMIGAPLTRLGQGMVSTWLKGGTSGQTYSLVCRAETTLDRVLEARARVFVRNVEV